MTRWLPSISSVVRVATLACGLVAGTWGCAAPRATHKVAIDGTAFRPEVLTVKAGDSIVWVNQDPFPHTVTSAAGGFDSKTLQPGQSWTYVGAAVGDFNYVCSLHPTMKARLRVE